MYRKWCAEGPDFHKSCKHLMRPDGASRYHCAHYDSYGVLVTIINGCGPSEWVGVPVGSLVGVKVSVGTWVGVRVFVGVLDGIGVSEGAGVSVSVGASRVSVGVRVSVALAGGLSHPSILDLKF